MQGFRKHSYQKCDFYAFIRSDCVIYLKNVSSLTFLVLQEFLILWKRDCLDTLYSTRYNNYIT